MRNEDPKEVIHKQGHRLITLSNSQPTPALNKDPNKSVPPEPDRALLRVFGQIEYLPYPIAWD